MLHPFRWHPWPFEVAHALGAVPLLYLAWLAIRYERRDASFWWLAGGYLVSFLADTASHWTGHPLVSSTYPILQSGLIAAAILNDRDMTIYVLIMGWAATAALGFQGVTGVDILLHTVCWLSLVGLAYQAKGVPFRSALMLGFGLGWLAWVWYAGWPGWGSWAGFQLTRVAGCALFCVAAARGTRRAPLVLLKGRAA